jgi:hypothetical protein
VTFQVQSGVRHCHLATRGISRPRAKVNGLRRLALAHLDQQVATGFSHSCTAAVTRR